MKIELDAFHFATNAEEKWDSSEGDIIWDAKLLYRWDLTGEYLITLKSTQHEPLYKGITDELMAVIPVKITTKPPGIEIGRASCRERV